MPSILVRARACALLCLAGLTAMPGAQAFQVFKVGGDSDCPYPTIQAAVDAAAATPGADYVWIAMNRSYPGQNIHVSDSDGVIIVGGLETCDDIDVDTRATTISGSGNDGSAVFTIRGHSSVTFENVFITGAQRDGAANGGGVDDDGYGELNFITSSISINSAGYGGGINARGNGGPLSVVLEHDTLVVNNTAQTSGGGVRVEGTARLFALQPQTLITLNHAPNGYGGGIEVIGPARADIGSPGYNGLGVVRGNDAQYGGGISINESANQEDAALRLFATDSQKPVQVSDNSASATGGGIYLGAHGDGVGNLTCLYDFRLDGNSAQEGAAIYAEQRGFVAINAAPYAPDPCELPEPRANLGAVACAAGIPCNTLHGNADEDTGGSATDGSTILLQSNARLAANRFSATGNSGAHVVREVADDSESVARMSNCLLADNVVTQELVAMTDGADDIGLLHIASCTIAGNAIGAAHVIRARHYIDLIDTIVDQIGHPTLDFSGTFFNVDYVLSNDTSTLPQHVDIALGLPSFVDAANGNYHLRPTSLGVDFAPVTSDTDLDGAPRTVDLPFANQYGPTDLGAYELQHGLACDTSNDALYCDGFDGG